MGASCSSSPNKKYKDALDYLRSKPCTTYTYARAFSPLSRDAPYIILIGEIHQENPSRKMEPRNRNCSTVSGILNEIASICSDPTSKATVFIEDEMGNKDHETFRTDTDVFLDIEDRTNPFNINRQVVLFDHMERNFEKNIFELVRGDVFSTIRGAFYHNEYDIGVGILETYFCHNLRLWLQNVGGIDNPDKYALLKQSGHELAEQHWSRVNEEMRRDKALKYISQVSHILLTFLETYGHPLVHTKVSDYTIVKFMTLFGEIERTYVSSTKRKREDESIPSEGRPHYQHVGDLITFLGDALSFYHISRTKDIVLVSFGQYHAEHFTGFVEASMLYKKDHSYG